MATHTFLYDDACPMCKGYTGLFTKLDWSDRKGFSTLRPGEWAGLDLDRGRHEIPLLDGATGKVRYGLDAMTTIVGRALPVLRPLVRHPYFIASLKPLYWLITYNRRVIAGTKAPAEGLDCAPDFHFGWRMAYVGLAFGVVALLGFAASYLLIGLGLVLAAGLLIHGDRIEFLGHFATVVLGAAILLVILPAGLGVGAAYGFVIWQGWRRLR